MRNEKNFTCLNCFTKKNLTDYEGDGDVFFKCKNCGESSIYRPSSMITRDMGPLIPDRSAKSETNEPKDQEMSNKSTAFVEMPEYKCDKTVWALAIAAVINLTKEGDEDDGSRLLEIKDEGYDSVPVTKEFVDEYDPQAGDYFVVSEGGYSKIILADAFEDAYTLIDLNAAETEDAAPSTDALQAIRNAVSLIDPKGVGHVPSGTPGQYNDALAVLNSVLED